MRKYTARRKNDTIMEQGRKSLNQKTNLVGEHISIHDERWWSHMHTLASPRRFWIDDSLPWETKFQKLPFSFGHLHMQEEQQGRNGNLPPCTFGMGDVKEEKNRNLSVPTYTFDMGDVKEKSNNMTYISVDTLSALSLLERLDPY